MKEHVFQTDQRHVCRIMAAPGLLEQVGDELPLEDHDGCFLIYDAVLENEAGRLEAALNCSWSRPLVAREEHKNLTTLGALAEELLEAGATRRSLIVALGGGMICDVVAFLGAIYMRGVQCALVPSTLLAMVDAAVGGKNGVDLGRHKNTLGVIRQPHFILIDPDLLTTLPDAALLDGLIEVVKKASILDRKVFEELEERRDALRQRKQDALLFAIDAAITMKLGVVARDERESDLRKLLNFGHTVGHALESLSGFRISHGAAVALGMKCEMAMKPFSGMERVLNLLSHLGADLQIPEDLQDGDALWHLMQQDKKSSRQKVYAAVPTEPGRGRLFELDQSDLKRVLAEQIRTSPEVRRVPPLLLPFDCALRLPGSKSEANRAIVAAALASGTTRILGATPGEDVVLLVRGLKAMGFDLSWTNKEKGELLVRGGLPAHSPDQHVTLHCGNGGTTLRFLLSVAALVPGRWILDGNEHMRRRPHQELVEAWQSLGCELESDGGHAPLRLRGGCIEGGTVTLDVSRSSQFLSSLMLAAPRLRRGLTIQLNQEPVAADYVHLTEDVLGAFGVDCRCEGMKVVIPQQELHSPGEFQVEGCWSSAGLFFCLAALTGSSFRGINLKDNSRQPDRHIRSLIADVLDEHRDELDLSRTPDQLMNLALVACQRRRPLRFTHVGNLRHKECDRLAVLARELQRVGVAVVEEPEALSIRSWQNTTPHVCFDPENDHRMVMALALAGLLGQVSSISSPGAVAKSWPGFWEALERVRRQRRTLVVVGMRGAGKTTLARALSTTLLMNHEDSDAIFAARHGPIADFVAGKGWPSFRRNEKDIIASLVGSHACVSLGGGAFDDEETAALALEKCVVVWLDEDPQVIRKRLEGHGAGRPSLTGAAPAEELQEVMERRRPSWDTHHHIRVPARLTLSHQVATVVKQLGQLYGWRCRAD